jgi:hypothetical protein
VVFAFCLTRDFGAGAGAAEAFFFALDAAVAFIFAAFVAFLLAFLI